MLGVGSLADFALASYTPGGGVVTVGVDKGSLTLTGKTILGAVTLPVVKGSLHLTGKDIPFYRVIVATGSLHLTGKSLPAVTTLPAVNGSLHLTSYPQSFTATITIDPGHLTLTGHDFFVGRVIVEPGDLTLTGKSILTVETIPVEPGSLRLRAGDPIALIPIGGASGSKRRLPKNYRTGFEPVTRKYQTVAKEPQRNPLPPFKPDAPRIAPAMPAPGGPKAVVDLKSLVGDIAAAESQHANSQDENDAADIAALLELLD